MFKNERARMRKESAMNRRLCCCRAPPPRPCQSAVESQYEEIVNSWIIVLGEIDEEMRQSGGRPSGAYRIIGRVLMKLLPGIEPAISLRR